MMQEIWLDPPYGSDKEPLLYISDLPNRQPIPVNTRVQFELASTAAGARLSRLRWEMKHLNCNGPSKASLEFPGLESAVPQPDVSGEFRKPGRRRKVMASLGIPQYFVWTNR